VDKKMRKFVTKPIRKAESLLKKAEKSNIKLANYDERVRDPAIKKLTSLTHKKLQKPPKLPKTFGKVK
jgi:hypothetical protein